ncbi:hypothetical protein J41TS12_47680 [Paenibacillus antibioticophila]|uniref:Uncharacterized protein n=1 Tax=Paenibacillus antibioticophila TaxID=1274374 RepID=A0A919Y0E7_9BACL|nr:hypothetical protein [Paenibacillus antibioticophila]GIO39907.1 hypothetical protein J41TS12_47680 [Paenibacillus antibioticophila]
MGVKHGRDYEYILKDLTEAIGRIQDCYLFFEMEVSEWEQLDQEAKAEVQEALAEDLFYGLGSEPVIEVGSAVVIHDPEGHRINFLIGEEELTSVMLI